MTSDNRAHMPKQHWGVICKNLECEAGIELEEYERLGGKKVESPSPSRKQRIKCSNCGREYEYTGEDFKVH